jgi:hypothetical protein
MADSFISDVLLTYDDFKHYRTAFVYLHRHREQYAPGSDAYTKALAERLRLAYGDKPPPVTADAITFTRQQLNTLHGAIRRSKTQLGTNASLEQAYAALHAKRTAPASAVSPAAASASPPTATNATIATTAATASTRRSALTATSAVIEDKDEDEDEQEQALCIKREQECQRLFQRLPAALLQPHMQSIRTIYEKGRITRPCFLWFLLSSELAAAWSDKDMKGINGAVCTAWRLTAAQLNKELDSWAWKPWQVRELKFRSTTSSQSRSLHVHRTNLSDPSNVALVVFALVSSESKLRAFTADLTRDEIHPRRWCTPALSAALGTVEEFDMDDRFTCSVADWMIQQEEGEDEEEHVSEQEDKDEGKVKEEQVL